VSVTMADENPRARALYSRHVAEKLTHPSLGDPQQLVEWLLAYGGKHPGTLLYPPNDHLAWLFAESREQLGKVFLTYQPDETAIITLLDKSRLHDACAAVGIEVPQTFALGPAGGGDPVVDRLRFPVLLKPRTQVFMEGGVKGSSSRIARRSPASSPSIDRRPRGAASSPTSILTSSSRWCRST